MEVVKDMIVVNTYECATTCAIRQLYNFSCRNCKYCGECGKIIERYNKKHPTKRINKPSEIMYK